MPKETTARHSEKSLRNLATQLKENAALLEAGAEALGTLGIPELTIKHANSAQVGMRGLDAFVRVMREAIRDASVTVEHSPKPKKRVRQSDTGAGK